MSAYLARWFLALREGVQRVHGDERGYSTEFVVITALAVALAVGVFAVLAHTVTDTASGIKTK